LESSLKNIHQKQIKMSTTNGSNKNETGVENLSKTLAEKVTIAGNATNDEQREELSPGRYLND